MSNADEPAFAFEGGNNNGVEPACGLSKREYAAIHAPISMMEAWGVWCNIKHHPFEDFRIAKERGPFLEWFCEIQREYADALLQGDSNE